MAILNMILKIFFGQDQNHFDPAKICHQFFYQIKKMMQSFIIVIIGSVLFCILITHLISRSLDLIDGQGFHFTSSINLLLFLIVIDLLVIIFYLKKATIEEGSVSSKRHLTPPQPTNSPMETALAALIIDFIKQREFSREKEKNNNHTPL